MSKENEPIQKDDFVSRSDDDKWSLYAKLHEENKVLQNQVQKQKLIIEDQARRLDVAISYFRAKKEAYNSCSIS